MDTKTLTELKDIYRKYGLKLTGVKSVLIARIAQYEASKQPVRKETDASLSDLPDELISNVVLPFLEFYDFSQLVGVNRRYKSLLTASLPSIVKRLASWEQQHYIVWASRFAPLELLTPLLTLEMDDKIKKRVVMYLTERGYSKLATGQLEDSGPSSWFWTVARELIIAIKNGCWMLVKYSARQMHGDLQEYLRIHLGELLASQIDSNHVKALLEHTAAPTSDENFILYILRAYLLAERYTDYSSVVKDTEDEFEFAQLLLPYITPSVYHRITSRKIFKKDLKHKLENRELYRSLTDDQRLGMQMNELRHVTRPEEYVTLCIRQKGIKGARTMIRGRTLWAKETVRCYRSLTPTPAQDNDRSDSENEM